MAKKNNPEEKSSWITKVKKFLLDDRVRIATACILLVFALFLTFAVLSFFFTGANDYSVLENGGNLTAAAAENWSGVRGAIISNFLVNKCFGISSVIIVYFLYVLSAKLFFRSKIRLLKQFIFSALALVWFSILFGSISLFAEITDSFIRLGGNFGNTVALWLKNNIGTPGVISTLIVTLFIYCIFAFDKTIPFLKHVITSLFSTKKKDEIEDSNPDAGIIDDVRETADDLSDKVTITSNQEEKTNDDIDANPDDFIVVKATDDMLEPAVKSVDLDNDDTDIPMEIEVNSEALVDDLGEYDPTLDLSDYQYPSVDLLNKYESSSQEINMDEQNANKNRIIDTLENYGIKIASITATVGPTITLYELIPEAGIRISKIRNLEDDIALSLAALGIRIIAPIPGKGTIGIEVPNRTPQVVSMYSVIASRKFQEAKYDLPVAIGRTITNEVFMVDLTKMPHMLVAGATGQGKSVGLNAIITSLLYKKHPSQLKFVLVDPKKVEFNIYSTIERHFLAKLPDEEDAIITDVTKVVQTLNSLCKEMDQRYDLLKKAHVRNIKEYNDKFVKRKLNPEKGHKYLPYIVVIIDEFGDLIMTAGKEVELPIARIAQLARAVGIHMIIATQRPSTNIITGIIKANFPARVAFRVSAMVDSRTILDQPGANQLIGRGDLLFLQGSELVRVQCAFVDTPEVEKISEFIGLQRGYPTAFALPECEMSSDLGGTSAGDLSERDPMFEEAARLIVINQQGSTSFIQRKMAIGYNRAGRIIDQLEAAGIVGPFDGSKARQVLVVDEIQLEQKLSGLN